jgi:hypothetical protein
VELVIGTEYYRSLLVTEEVQKEVKNKGVVMNIMANWAGMLVPRRNRI